MPLSQMIHLKREPSYHSPTESLLGCYEEEAVKGEETVNDSGLARKK